MLSRTFRTLWTFRPSNIGPWQQWRGVSQRGPYGPSEESLLWALKPSVVDEVIDKMMSHDDKREVITSERKEREKIIVLNNPGKLSFIESFLKLDVKHVLCVYTFAKLLKNMGPVLNKVQNKSSKLMCIFPNDGLFAETYKDVDLKDTSVKVLLRQTDADDNIIWKKQIYSFIQETGLHAAGNLEWYCAIHPLQYQTLQTRNAGLFLPPYYHYSQVMKLQKNDFVPKFKPKSVGLDKGDDIVLVKAEPNYTILNYLPTVKDRKRFSRFYRMKAKVGESKRIAPLLHEWFPGCLDHLTDHGFYINAVNKDINMQSLLHLYLILSKLPGFEDSQFNETLGSA